MAYVLNPNYFCKPKLNASMTYGVCKSSVVKVQIFDDFGKLVKTLFRGNQPSGCYTLKWDGKNDQGNLVSNGIYFYKVTSADLVQTKRMFFKKRI